MSDCYVYMIKAGDGKKPKVKIGVSERPKNRMRALQTGNPDVLSLVMTIKCNSRPDAFRVEKAIHSGLKSNRVNGEWFTVSRSSFFKCINNISNNVEDGVVEKFEEVITSKPSKYDGKSRTNLVQKIINLSEQCKEQELALSKRKNKCRIMSDLLCKSMKISHEELELKISKIILNEK